MILRSRRRQETFESARQHPNSLAADGLRPVINLRAIDCDAAIMPPLLTARGYVGRERGSSSG